MSAFNLRSFVARIPRPVLLGGGLVLLALLGLLVITLLPGPGENEREIASPMVPVNPAPASPAVPAASPFPLLSTTQAQQQIKFVTSLCRDRQGRVWIGTEDAGLWRYDPNARVAADYIHFAAADGPGDDTVYALACDKSGRIWAGTLNHGVAVFNGRKWQSYAPPDGPLGFHVTALAVNPVSGGVWMATEAGLARYEQKQWTYYTRADGLVSDKATALAFAPNGTLYVGTECDGIAIGSPHNNYKTWHTVPGPVSPPNSVRGDGLPSALINCLLVTPGGEAWAGTTAGLARSSDGGQTWHFRRGGDWKDKARGQFTTGLADQAKVNGIEIIPATGCTFAFASGKAAGRFQASSGFAGGHVAATAQPIDTAHVIGPAPQAVYQVERFGDFTFTAPRLKPQTRCRVRLHFAEAYFRSAGCRVFDVLLNGRRILSHFDIFQAAGGGNRALVREFAASADAQGRLELTFQGAAPGSDSAGLGEDYVTCLASSGAGLFVGHRQQPPELIALRSGKAQILGPSAYAEALLPLGSGGVLAGNYGEGLSLLPVENARAAGLPTLVSDAVAELPLPPAPPSLAQLNAMLAQVALVVPDPQELRPHVTALSDDWLTQGDWLGRYGRYWAVLAAFFHPIPEDYVWGAGWEPVQYAMRMGPSHASGDSLRYYLHWRYTDNPCVLEMPAAYVHSRVLKHYTSWQQNRRETEWDDHGEVYPQSMEGPNIYATLTVPEGLYFLSLYDFNKDGHDSANRFRDYRLSVRAHAGQTLEDVSSFPAQPELAHGRTRNFWGGVWKRFLVRGPLTLTAEVNRNHSVNAILPAVMLDLADERPAPYFQTVSRWNAHEAARDQERADLARHPLLVVPASTETEAANRLFEELEQKQLTNSAWHVTEGQRYYAALLRWYADASSVKPGSSSNNRWNLRLATCEYQIGRFPLWEKWQHKAGLTTARQIETSLRWDGVTNSYSGLGYQIVSAHQSEMTGRKLSQSR